MAVTYIDIPVSLEDLGSDGTPEDLARFIGVFAAKVIAAFPEAKITVREGSGFDRIHADSPEEERDAKDYISQLAADAQIESLIEEE